MSLKDFGKQLYAAFMRNDLLGMAAQLSYYFLFALFPLLFFFVTLAAYLPLQGSVNDLLSRMAVVMPKEAMDIIQQHFNELLGNPRPKLLSLSLVFAIWTASRGVDALRSGLNLAYDVKETRSWWRLQLLSVVMTIAGSFLVLLSFALIILGGKLGFYIADHMHIGKLFLFVWTWLRFPISAATIMLLAALCYYFLPDVKQQFKFITPGSVLGTLLWVLSTWAFTLYAEHFGSYNATYGSIGGIVVLMTWLYLSGFIFLLGGQMNAVIEHASAEGKAPGAKAPGEPAPPPQERPSAAAPGTTKSAGANLAPQPT